MEQGDAPAVRHAARVILLDEANRVLLVRFEDAQRQARWWAAPGGALRCGETHEEAAGRELKEETGLRQTELGPWIWTREHVFQAGGRLYHQKERFFLARVRAFEAHPTSLESGEADVFQELRWWSLAELEATSDALSPRALPALVRSLLEQGPPKQPRLVGV